MANDENYYCQCFTTLTVNRHGTESAPHKPVLLLAVIDLYEYGVLKTNEIELSNALECSFLVNWSRYAQPSEFYRPTIATPFWHLGNEPFWHLVSKTGADIKHFSSPYSKNKLKKHFFAVIDDELPALLEKATFRDEARNLLITTYLK